jgi:hypothetical protein
MFCPVSTSGSSAAYCACPLIAEIRADERDTFMDEITSDHAALTLLTKARANTLADLRAKVEALMGSPNSALDWVLRVDVLALLEDER